MDSIGVEHRPRVLSIRQRYVARSRYLKTHPRFRHDVDRRRAEWDANWPEFAIGNPGQPDLKLVYSPDGGALVPPRLYEANRIGDDVMKGRRPQSPAFDELEGRVTMGFYEWKQFTGAMCDEWWPRSYYPLIGGEHHIARRFVAGCLLWSPKRADEEWISSYTLQPYPLPAPIECMPYPADFARLQGWGKTLMNHLNDAAAARQVLTPELLTEMWQNADDAGQAAWDSCREELRGKALTSDHGDLTAAMTHWVVPVFPGLTWEDWEQATRTIMNTLRFKYGEHALREAARRLYQEGQSIRSIAGLLGVSRPAVTDWLEGPD